MIIPARSGLKTVVSLSSVLVPAVSTPDLYWNLLGAIVRSDTRICPTAPAFGSPVASTFTSEDSAAFVVGGVGGSAAGCTFP